MEDATTSPHLARLFQALENVDHAARQEVVVALVGLLESWMPDDAPLRSPDARRVPVIREVRTAITRLRGSAQAGEPRSEAAAKATVTTMRPNSATG